MTLRDSLTSMLDDLDGIAGSDRCQVCLAAAPEWALPVRDSATARKAADAVDVDAAVTQYEVCTDCLVLIEEKDPDAIARVTTDAVMRNGSSSMAGMPKVARKRMRMQTFMMTRKAAAEILSEIDGDPVRL